MNAWPGFEEFTTLPFDVGSTNYQQSTNNYLNIFSN